jgi:hypothetical protein
MSGQTPFALSVNTRKLVRQDIVSMAYAAEVQSCYPVVVEIIPLCQDSV